MDQTSVGPDAEGTVMSDLEELLTQHLMQKAATAEARHDLDGVLHEEASAASLKLRRRPSPPRQRWMPPVAVAAAVLAVAGTLAIALRSQRSTVETGDPGTVTSTGEDDVTSPAETTDDVRLTTQAPLGANGFAVISGTEVRLYDGEGNVLGSAPIPEAADWANIAVDGLVAREDGETVVLTPDVADGGYAARGFEPGQDCAELDRSSAGAIETCRVADRDQYGRELVMIDADGTRRQLAGAVYPDGVIPGTNQPVAGHWARAMVSPDGEWVAAQWSGECEVQTTFLVRTADGAVFDTAGQPLGSVSGDWPASESLALGWSDSRAIVADIGSACGSANGSSAVRSIDPATGAGTELVPLTGAEGGIVLDRVAPWRQATDTP
jgi:hypothetical protein